MKLTIEVSDQLTPAIQEAVRKNPQYAKRLANSIGWFYQYETKKVHWDEATEEWQERIPYNIRKALVPTAPKAWYGKMKQAIGYSAYQGVVDIGWTSYTSAMYGKLQEEGFSRAVTPKVRGFWARAGRPLSGKKTELIIPERPIFEPMVGSIRRDLPPFIEEKVKGYIAGIEHTSSRKRREYKVYK